jgi:hypothetical protein
VPTSLIVQVPVSGGRDVVMPAHFGWMALLIRSVR